MFARSENLRAIDSRWHEFRQNARETAFDESEFGPIEKERYDLDTAGITGEENPRTYSIRDPTEVAGTDAFDIRDLPDR